MQSEEPIFHLNDLCNWFRLFNGWKAIHYFNFYDNDVLDFSTGDPGGLFFPLPVERVP